MTTVTTSTELDAVNVMLSVIGEAPVSSLDIPGFVDVDLAKQILDETSVEIQSMEWECNSEKDYTLTPDNSSYIQLPTNILKLDITADFDSKYRPVQRGTRLYDKLNHTFVWTEPVTVDILWLLPYTDLPESLRRYITIAAARRFQKRYFSSSDVDRFTQEDEFRARAECVAADVDVADYNMMDNYTVSRTLDR
jgi:hypothetical protein